MPTPLLTIADAGINLGDRWLLRHADVTLHAGDRLALVGRNGAGKSSLMKLMAGRTDMDEGSLWMAPGPLSPICRRPRLPTGMTLRSVVVAVMTPTGWGDRCRSTRPRNSCSVWGSTPTGW